MPSSMHLLLVFPFPLRLVQFDLLNAREAGSLLQAGEEQCDSQALTVGLFLLQCTDADGPAVNRARAWCEMTNVPYFR